MIAFKGSIPECMKTSKGSFGTMDLDFRSPTKIFMVVWITRVKISFEIHRLDVNGFEGLKLDFKFTQLDVISNSSLFRFTHLKFFLKSKHQSKWTVFALERDKYKRYESTENCMVFYLF